MHLYETHLHTGGSSRCAQVPADEIMAAYASLGYEGVAITNHYSMYAFGNEGIDHFAAADWFVHNYIEAAKCAVKNNILPILGMEICFVGTTDDYLVYGFDMDFVYRNFDMHYWGLDRFSAYCREHNIFIAQAHPFRVTVHPAPVQFLDGVEVYNGNPRHDSHDDVADNWAKENNLIRITGSDYHLRGDEGAGGIYLPHTVKNGMDFAAALRAGGFGLVKPENQRENING